MASSTASAATYLVANDAQLRAAITAANGDGDPNALIRMTAAFSVGATALPTPTKPMTIDTQGFASAPLSFSGLGSQVTLVGAFQGAAGAPGQRGLALANQAFVINSGSITGGDGGGSSTSGAGATLLNASTLVNNGTIRGGGSGGGSAGGYGIQLSSGSTLINNGLVQAGDGQGVIGGVGVFMIASPLQAASTLVNTGTIRGGNDVTGVNAGTVGIQAQGKRHTIVNSGIIEGGDRAAGVQSTNGGLQLTNSGTIRAGAGGTTAISVSGAATTDLTLELQAGSAIEGNVIANATSTTDTLRLGGTANDTFDVSAIGLQYQNFDTYEKTGTSTWALTGTGTATTNWNIQDGTLQLGNGGTSGSVIGDITTASAGTLAFNRSNTFTFDNLVLGTGTISQIGTGTTIMTADNSAFAGSTTIEAGTLSVNGILGGTVNVQTGGRLQGTGDVGTTTSDGTIAPGNSIGTLTVNGNYTGNGGTLVIETELGDDASPTDRLVVTGDTAGTTNVRVTNVGGTGAETVEGIKVVDVGGASNGAFSLLGDYVIAGQQAVVAGAYGYTLNKNGVSTPGDGDWYLRSELTPTTQPPATGPLYQPGAPLYETYAQSLQVLNGVGSMQQRIGNRYWAGAGSAMIAEGDGPGTPEAAPLPSEGGTATIDAGAIWARIDGAHSRVDPDRSTTQAEYDYNIWRLQSGLDGKLYENQSGTLMGGVTFQYGEISTDVSSIFGKGSIDTDGYGFGGTLTWLAQNGFYVDGQAQLNWYDSDITSDTLGQSLTNGNDGFGYALSLETGKRIIISESWSITPQAQLAYSNVDFDDFTDPFGADVSLDKSDSLKGRLGVSADYQNAWQDASGRMARSNIYGLANLYHEFLDGSEVDLVGVNFANESDRTWGGIGAGGSYSWADDKYALYGEVSLNTSLSNFADSYSVNGTTGFKVKF
ncbi:autotransporter outer membrane beta-barrel domain-containing protein [Phyllobacterium zundukense]|uniref:Autotransporter outer membrane beta-barrel domain-containing protein n=1 Tax=Phyllobacterium zundukense TaxID=1867719 RepID=A0ACD4D2M7_9HYPH|nr:autotransporter outer membrane beta-barrel domain-containing protein [Phyllobacterium zundukense]